MIACAVLGTVASNCTSAAGTSADSSARAPADSTRPAGLAPGYASLFVRATDQRQPLIGGVVIIEGFKLGAMTDENGSATVDRIPAGKHVVRWSLIGYEIGHDTLTFTAGRQETLLVTDPPLRRHAPDELDLPESEIFPRVTVPSDHPLRRRLGVVWISGDTAQMVSEFDSLTTGSLVAVLLMNGKGEPRRLRILTRLGPLDPASPRPFSIARSRLLWSYRLEKPARREKSARVGLGVVDLHGDVRSIGARLAVDLDGDGAPEVVTRCADSDGLLLLVRNERDHKLLWRALCRVPSQAVEPVCTDEDTELLE